jgi:hypothetical protein
MNSSLFPFAKEKGLYHYGKGQEKYKKTFTVSVKVLLTTLGCQ